MTDAAKDALADESRIHQRKVDGAEAPNSYCIDDRLRVQHAKRGSDYDRACRFAPSRFHLSLLI
jgi:hypothetical protein